MQTRGGRRLKQALMMKAGRQSNEGVGGRDLKRPQVRLLNVATKEHQLKV